MRHRMFSKRGLNISTGIFGLLASGTVLKNLDIENESKKKVRVRNSTRPYTRDTVLDGYELKLVQIFVRHGARTPIHTTPNVEQV